MKVATSAPKNIVILSSTSNILKISAIHQLIILSRFINTNKLLDIGISYY